MTRHQNVPNYNLYKSTNTFLPPPHILTSLKHVYTTFAHMGDHSTIDNIGGQRLRSALGIATYVPAPLTGNTQATTPFKW